MVWDSIESPSLNWCINSIQADIEVCFGLKKKNEVFLPSPKLIVNKLIGIVILGNIFNR